MKVLDQAHGQSWSLYHGDSVEVVKGLPDNSVRLWVFSPPFSTLYRYSQSLRDMGNTKDDSHFFKNFDYLIPELWRATIPGGLAVVHCKDLPLFFGTHGVAGLRDFPGELRRRFCGEATEYLTAKLDGLMEAIALVGSTPELAAKAQELEKELMWQSQNNWVLHSKVTVWKDPVIEMERTNNHGLLHGQLCKDSSVSRQGMADFLLVFRKWDRDEMTGMNSVIPVTESLLDKNGQSYKFTQYFGEEEPNYYETPRRSLERDRSIRIWQKYASPTWNDIQQTEVLNKKINGKKLVDAAKEDKREPHICCLQLDLIARCIELWSNADDIVCDPFNGVGSTGYQAIQMGRKYVGVELKQSYFEIAKSFFTDLESNRQLSLEDLLRMQEVA